MTAETESLLRAVLQGKEGELQEIGREFFSTPLDRKNTCEFITTLLEKGAYEKLAEIFSQGFISKQYSDRDYLSKSFASTLEQRYFDLFVDTCERCFVERQALYPMFAAAFSSTGILGGWRNAIRLYFVKVAYADYDRAEAVFAQYDDGFDLYPILFHVDPQRAEDAVLNLLLYKKNVNKTVIRRYLLENKIDILPKIIAMYTGAAAKQKESLVRLLLIYKNDARASRFLDRLYKTETSKTVRKLLERDRMAKGGKAGSRSYKERFFAMMLSGERMPFDAFLKAIRTEDGGRVASTLFFTQYRQEGVRIVIVDQGHVLDLENRPLAIDDGEFGVLHPADLSARYEFLKQLNIQQSFEQIRRDVYTPSAEEKAYRVCKRFNGTVITQGALRSGIRKYGFRLMNHTRSGVYTQIGLLREDVLCVTEFAATDFKQPEKAVSIGDVRFYRYSDVIKLAGSWYVEGVRPCEIELLPPRLFSEFLYGIYMLLRCK